eukprot:GHVS01041771.1.p1 GENE.GHVS01041771.1~~GHVS01041771.1.p1  ORF type:complete len:376 (+),score=74.29 GHVS01041771.1:131-1258(+)
MHSVVGRSFYSLGIGKLPRQWWRHCEQLIKCREEELHGSTCFFLSGNSFSSSSSCSSCSSSCSSCSSSCSSYCSLPSRRRFSSPTGEGFGGSDDNFADVIAKALSHEATSTHSKQDKQRNTAIPEKTPTTTPRQSSTSSPLSSSLTPSPFLPNPPCPPPHHIEDLWKGGYLDPSIGIEAKRAQALSGDAWPACLLRMKSFEDLHKLWFVCLKEKNLLQGEQWAAWQQAVRMESAGRLKKVKMTMKRILTVLSRREIHQQAIRAQEILTKQKHREELETKRYHIEEQITLLKNKIELMGNAESVTRSAWLATLQRYATDKEELMLKLKPLRKETMQLLAPDWRYQRKYSDLPGPVSWNKQSIPALNSKFSKPVKVY